MLGRFAVSLFLLLLAREFNSTDGYVLSIRDGGNKSYVTACVSDETPIAFVRNYQSVNDTVTVTVVDLNGKSVPLADNDCNLVQETGCGKWNLKEWIKEWIKESNIKDSIDQYPMVTDYRWNDLPVTLTMEAFKEKIKISKYHNFKMHFSILANDSAQFLFTNDSTLNSGLNAVIDGWADDHKSVLRNCPKINGSKVDTSGVIYASCDKNSLVEKKGSDVLHAGRKWAHATLEIQFDKSNENYSIDLGEHIIKISLQTASAKLGDNDNYVSIRSTRSSRGLFKTHKYFIIRPNNASSTMEVQLKKDSTSAFCVDAVFLTNERINLGNKIFSVELLDAKGTKKFDERVSSMDNYFKWTTVRFGNKDITPKKGWKIKLTAYDKSLVIGGVKFCKEGELVTKTNMKYVDNCYSLEKRAQTQIPNTTHFNELLYKLGNCKENGGKCSGDKLCYSKENCTCFAGYKGTDCTERCTGDKFGIMCSYTNNRTCLNGSFSPVNGSCLNGCAIGYVYPECHKKIQTATPKVKSHGYDTVALDLLASLNGTVNISQILIQYKISSQSDWNNKSINVPNELNECSISNLNPKTEYTIRFTLFESDVMQHPQNFLPGNNSTFTTKCKPLDSTALKVRAVNSSAFSIHLSDGDVLCTPIYLTVVHNATVIVNQTENKGDFTKVVDNCNCGVHSITVYYFVNMSSSSLHENFTCSNCPTQDKLGNISSSLTPIATVLAVLAVLTGLGVWFYLKKWKNIQPPNQISSVQFSNNSAILRNEMLPNQTGANQFTDDNTEMPIDSSSTNVERYLQKALTFNLKKEFEKFPRGQTQSWDCGTKSQNKKKNRYGNLAAYDCSRVVLDLLPGDENSDYINANYVDGFERPKAYIATQGPKLSTVNDFWRMIWQENISLIVMVTNLVEDGKIKCEKYWPDINREENYGTVAVRSVNEEINADYVTRTLSFSSDNVNRLVQQLHYTSWPDHGVPLYPQSMALFIDKIIQHKNKNPILIHCSAGVGRTGTIILIDACLRMFRSHNRIDVLSIFGQMRSQRVNLVDNLAQFEFVHLVLLEIIANPKFEISCANFYEEYCKLMSNSEKLKESFAKVEMICEKDFQRLETPARNETDKCRYPDFIASSNAIVKLFPYENVVTMSFINAVIVDGYNRAKQFIATQVPMKNTVADFWRLIDQFNVKQIVVLTEPHISDGDFLPTKQRRFAFGAIQVTLADAEDDNNIRTLDIELHSKGKCKKVRVMCASFGWMPQQAAPPILQPFIDLWGTLKTAHEKDSITIVCHDGVTASGLFLAMGFVIEKIKLEQKVDVGLAVRTLRKSRPSFVSSEIQFGLVYEAAKQYLNSFDTYGNFK
ncbi:receptor-type tyrosine-protein phosphatase alpha-like [Cloeon dipterum]|uniref:receptor-type tyrosine-protein phosphatase alpha-like n=1 Tax=Cloeon dipterum TaxID=197152 RepID=UPI003220426D